MAEGVDMVQRCLKIPVEDSVMVWPLPGVSRANAEG